MNLNSTLHWFWCYSWFGWFMLLLFIGDAVFVDSHMNMHVRAFVTLQMKLFCVCVICTCVCATVPCCFVIKAEVKSNFPYFAVLEVNCKSHAAPGKLSSILVLSCVQTREKIVSAKREDVKKQ